MSKSELLTNRKWHTCGGWFSAKRFIKESSESVVFCDHIETTSSAGDWTGLIIQKVENKLHVILFSQENTFSCREGFDIYTADRVSVTLEDASKISSYRELADDICAMLYSD
jgi:hypothetical protein